jgi:hypothetical protein
MWSVGPWTISDNLSNYGFDSYHEVSQTSRTVTGPRIVSWDWRDGKELCSAHIKRGGYIGPIPVAAGSKVRMSSADRTLGSWVRIPLDALMYDRGFLCCEALRGADPLSRESFRTVLTDL